MNDYRKFLEDLRNDLARREGEYSRRAAENRRRHDSLIKGKEKHLAAHLAMQDAVRANDMKGLILRIESFLHPETTP